MNEPKDSLKSDPTKFDFESWEDYVFDPSFFDQGSIGSEGCTAIFKLDRFTDNQDVPENVYLHIYNDHNGYYAHGFKMKINGKTIQQGDL